MAFFSRETIRPEVVDVYGPYQDVRGQLDTVYDEAQNRASQRINQLYANVGMNPRGAPATSAKARATTDIENQRAQLGYQSYYDWLRGKQLATPQVMPSGLSTIAAPFITGLGYQAAPGIVNAASKGLGNAWDWMSGSLPSLDFGSQAEGPGYGFGGWEGAYGDVMPITDWSLNTPDFSSAYEFSGW